jgi:hypothetical protein
MACLLSGAVLANLARSLSIAILAASSLVGCIERSTTGSEGGLGKAQIRSISLTALIVVKSLPAIRISTRRPRAASLRRPLGVIPPNGNMIGMIPARRIGKSGSMLFVMAVIRIRNAHGTYSASDNYDTSSDLPPDPLDVDKDAKPNFSQVQVPSKAWLFRAHYYCFGKRQTMISNSASTTTAPAT